MQLTGHLTDPFDARDLKFKESVLLSSKPTVAGETIDHRIYVPKIFNQIANNCVSHSIKGSAFLCMAIAGTPIEELSSLFPYCMARLLGDPVKKPGEPKLTDWGCGPRFAMKGIKDYGLVSEKLWPEIPQNVDTVPPLDAFQDAAVCKIDRYYRIEDGVLAADGIVEALRRGKCPIFGMTVDDAYANIGKGVYEKPGGQILGGHCQIIVGYSKNMNAFLVLNSWGKGFGDEGYAWISASFVNQSTFDKWVIEAVN